MKLLIIIPTYNEKETIVRIITEIGVHVPYAHVLVVDDNSPDGTAEIVKDIQSQNPQVHLLQRAGKEGLGTAYIAAFHHTFKTFQPERIVMMDADLSHHPRYVVEMERMFELGFPVVVGSRYVTGGSTVGWSLWRKALSYFGNLYAKMVTGIPVRDVTAGFYIIDAAVLQTVDFDKIASSGYAFQMELKCLLFEKTKHIAEVPIAFGDRTEGESKISKGIIAEGVLAPWKIKMKNKILYVFGVIFLLTCIPFTYAAIQGGSSWRGVVPSFVNDDLYYYARMENIEHGYPFIGNPYYFEHRGDISPAFFAADWIAAVPLLLGMPFIPAIGIDFIFWSLVFGLLVYMLFGEYELPDNVRAWATVLTYCMVYILILRPVSMQIVAPFFVLFLIAYARWLKTDRTTRRDSLFLAVATACSFYIYTYSWQVSLVVLGLTGVYMIYRKKWSQLKDLVLVLCGAFLLATPIILYTLKQFANPYYWDSLGRIGLVYTHVPTALSVYDSVAIGVILGLWYVVQRFIGWGMHLNEKKAFLFVVISGLAFIVADFSNVITGKDVEVSNHFERFIIIWIAFAVIFSVYILVKNHTRLLAISQLKKTFLGLLCVTTLSIGGYFLWHGFGITSVLTTNIVSVQPYAAPLLWLKEKGDKEAVVWSNQEIGSYIPIMTTDFTLFNLDGGLHLLPSSEQEERYLVSRYFDNLTVTDIETDFRQYAGVGNAVHQYKTYNRKVHLCDIVLARFGTTCGQTTNAVDFKGLPYFQGLFTRYSTDIKPHIVNELQKFHVRYLLKDMLMDTTFHPENIPGTQLVWHNDRFEIYSLSRP